MRHCHRRPARRRLIGGAEVAIAFRPREEWPHFEDGSLNIYTRPLRLGDLMSELEADPDSTLTQDKE